MTGLSVTGEEERKALALALAELIRQASREERLIGREELRTALADRCTAAGGSGEGAGPEAPGPDTPMRAVPSPDAPGPDGEDPDRSGWACYAGNEESPEAALDLPDLDALLAETLAANDDLAVAAGEGGERFYHSPPLMSRTYAAILAGRSSPCRLMADEVRRNSAEYPRPVPLDLFEYPPFDLAPETIEACLKALADDPACADISFTTTSAGTVYLFSTRSLDRAYAAFLAERADVGLASNP